MADADHVCGSNVPAKSNNEQVGDSTFVDSLGISYLSL